MAVQLKSKVVVARIGTFGGDMREVEIPEDLWGRFATLLAKLPNLPEGIHSLEDFLGAALGDGDTDIPFTKDGIKVDKRNPDWNRFFAARSTRRH